MFKIIKSSTDPEIEYEIQYFGVVAGKDGKDVEVIINTDHTTTDQLEAQKTALQAQIKEIDLKLAEIAKL